MKRILIASLLFPMTVFTMDEHRVTLSLTRERQDQTRCSLLLTKMTVADQKEQSVSFAIFNSGDTATIVYTVTLALLKADGKNMTAKYSVERAEELPNGHRTGGILRNSYEHPIQMNQRHVEPLKFFGDHSNLVELGLKVQRVPAKAKM